MRYASASALDSPDIIARTAIQPTEQPVQDDENGGDEINSCRNRTCQQPFQNEFGSSFPSAFHPLNACTSTIQKTWHECPSIPRSCMLQAVACIKTLQQSATGKRIAQSGDVRAWIRSQRKHALTPLAHITSFLPLPSLHLRKHTLCRLVVVVLEMSATTPAKQDAAKPSNDGQPTESPDERGASVDAPESGTPSVKTKKKRLGVDPSLIISDGRSKRRKSPTPEAEEEMGRGGGNDPKDPARAKTLGYQIYNKIMTMKSAE